MEDIRGDLHLGGLDGITNMNNNSTYTSTSKNTKNESMLDDLIKHEELRNKATIPSIISSEYEDRYTKLISRESALIPSTYPIALYLNESEIVNFRGWQELFLLFCDYCTADNREKFSKLKNSKSIMGLSMAENKGGLIRYGYTDNSKLLCIHGVWFNLNAKGVAIGTAIFRIAEHMGFKNVAIEVKKFDNSEFELE